MALDKLCNYLADFPGFILAGFGKEGKSSFGFIRKKLPDKKIIIADINPDIQKLSVVEPDSNITVYSGENYLNELPSDFLLLLSPGIKLTGTLKNHPNLSSQTDLFLQFFRNQCIGITGTKGKSTTSSLMAHILKSAGTDHVLLGNIGSPPFDHLDNITEKTMVVFELSSHQLLTTKHSPHIAVLLNLFPEHLDHYVSVKEYFLAKMNIIKNQQSHDILICNADQEILKEYLTQTGVRGNLYLFSESFKNEDGIYLNGDEIIMKCSGRESALIQRKDTILKGKHNLLNIMAATCCAALLDIPSSVIRKAVKSFSGLEHRLEFAGSYNDKYFYNDSIATVPQAAIAAIQSIEVVDTLILGGYDRGLNYHDLYDKLKDSCINNLVFYGVAGKRMYDELKSYSLTIKLIYEKDFSNSVKQAIDITKKEGICLLSPAAASYDQFSGFEERGKVFKELVKSSFYPGKPAQPSGYKK